ncbi:hypothetical protein BpHYR1_011151 [Brachionus plicatilis]|uniref:Uncharacterized protein n=1 Tax=Brachionus plicatilis TaxID=10195 RepID=A0A3M7QTA8_BRAPC|nr:hypothetical protein BpHYR1_011151 [Brachionus plicatilis]
MQNIIIDKNCFINTASLSFRLEIRKCNKFVSICVEKTNWISLLDETNETFKIYSIVEFTALINLNFFKNEFFILSILLPYVFDP